MSESKHTPGEWLLVDHTVYALNDQGENRFTALVQGGWVHRGSFSSERTSEDEKSANARLIASAPDLRAALVNLMTLVSPMVRGNKEFSVTWRKYEREARAAIAKAEGRDE